MLQQCKIQDCGAAGYVKGLCCAHYKRLRKYGDPLGGGTHRGEPLRFLLETAVHHQSDKCLCWPYGENGKGYGRVRVDGMSVYPHRVVCKVANGNSPSPNHDAAHSCGNRACVNPRHLSWKTHTDNCADKVIHDTHNRGERHPEAKLTEAQVKEILRLRGIKTQRQLAEDFGVSKWSIRDIQRRKNWAWLGEAA